MNAKVCNLLAKIGHLTIDGKEPVESDFHTLKHDEQKKDENSLPEMGDTPEMIQRKLEMLTISMGGKVIHRG